MSVLLWKDFRLTRVILFAGVLIAAAPYVIFAPAQEMNSAWRSSAFTSQLVLALVAGNIIAGERADRSAEFLAFQGASRRLILASKAVLCLLAYVAVCAVMVAAARSILPPAVLQKSWMFQLSAAATGFALWGCCWLLSSFLESPVLATVLGAMGPMIVYAGLSAVADQTWNGDDMRLRYSAVCVVLGVTALVGGSVVYLKRTEP